MIRYEFDVGLQRKKGHVACVRKDRQMRIGIMSPEIVEERHPQDHVTQVTELDDQNGRHAGGVHGLVREGIQKFRSHMVHDKRDGLSCRFHNLKPAS